MTEVRISESYGCLQYNICALACRKRNCLSSSVCRLPAVCIFSLHMHVAKDLRDQVRMGVLRCNAETTPYIGRNIEGHGGMQNVQTSESLSVVPQ